MKKRERRLPPSSPFSRLPPSPKTKDMPEVKKPHHSAETREAAVKALDHMDILDVCKTFDVSRSTLSSWKEKWESTHDLSRRKPRTMNIKPKEPPTKSPLQIIDVDALPDVLPQGDPPMYNMVFSDISVKDIMKISEIIGRTIPEWIGDMITEPN